MTSDLVQRVTGAWRYCDTKCTAIFQEYRCAQDASLLVAKGARVSVAGNLARFDRDESPIIKQQRERERERRFSRTVARAAKSHVSNLSPREPATRRGARGSCDIRVTSRRRFSSPIEYMRYATLYRFALAAIAVRTFSVLRTDQCNFKDNLHCIQVSANGDNVMQFRLLTLSLRENSITSRYALKKKKQKKNDWL